MQATKDVLAMASLEVDLSKIEEGNTITVKWRGKPVFIKRRTEAEVCCSHLLARLHASGIGQL